MRKKLDWLQAMRGVAALAVVITHCRFVLSGTQYADAANYWLLPLASGVDLFFVISGFIIVYSTQTNGIRSPLTFWRHRIRRLWPAYFVMSTVALLILPDAAQWTSIRAYLLSIFFLPADYSGVFGHQTLAQGWTLNFEACFYAVFGASLFLKERARWIALLGWFAATLIVLPTALGAASLTNAWLPYTYGYPVPYLALATNPIIWEFVAGGAVGMMFLSPLHLTLPRPSIAVVAALAAMAAVVNAFRVYNYVSLEMGAGFAIAIALISLCSKSIHIWAPRALVKLGDVSYTLYIQHYLVIVILMMLADRFGLISQLHSLAGFFFTAVLCVVLALLTSRFLERDIGAGVARAWRWMVRRSWRKIRSGISDERAGRDDVR